MRRSSCIAFFLLIWILGLGDLAQAQTLTITLVTVSDFTPVTLDGTQKSATASMDTFSVTDSRETGEGWHVTVQATLFRQWDGVGYVNGGASLPQGSLSMPAPTVTAIDTTSPPPAITPGPYLIDGSTVKIASAAIDAGMGRYDFTHSGPLTVTIPASAYAVTYRSEVAVSIASGP